MIKCEYCDNYFDGDNEDSNDFLVICKKCDRILRRTVEEMKRCAEDDNVEWSRYTWIYDDEFYQDDNPRPFKYCLEDINRDEDEDEDEDEGENISISPYSRRGWS